MAAVFIPVRAEALLLVQAAHDNGLCDHKMPLDREAPPSQGRVHSVPTIQRWHGRPRVQERLVQV
eukprot:5345772-Lingulodinium_polyedra.AAC.1